MPAIPPYVFRLRFVFATLTLLQAGWFLAAKVNYSPMEFDIFPEYYRLAFPIFPFAAATFFSIFFLPPKTKGDVIAVAVCLLICVTFAGLMLIRIPR